MTAPYGSTVLEHFRRPRNQRSLDRVTASHEGFNKQCGDRVRIELEVEGPTIKSAAFTANACAICTASASLLTERVNGGSVERALAVSDDEAVAALGEDVPRGRRGCATLPWETLRRALSA
jgi:nitrogen fixation protein NifU and related proteins